MGPKPSKENRKVMTSFKNFEEVLNSKGIKIAYNQADLERKINTISDKTTLERLETSVTEIDSILEDFMSASPYKIASTGLGIVASLVTLIPVIGEVSGVLFTVATLIAQTIGGLKILMSDIIAGVVEKALAKDDDEELKREAAGVKEELVSLQRFLTEFAKTGQYSKEEVLAMNSANLAKLGKRFLGILKACIKRYVINKSSTDAEAIVFQATRAVDYMEIFCHVTALRELVLIQYYCILKTVGGAKATASSIWNAITIDDNEEKEVVEIVTKKYTKPEYAAFMSVFDRSKQPGIVAFLARFNMTAAPTIRLDSKRLQIKQQRWPKYYAHVYEHAISYSFAPPGPFSYYLKGTNKTTEASYFTFHQINANNKYYIKTSSSINGYVTPKGDGNVKVETDESSESQWKVLQLPDKGGKQFYLFASVKYPTKFMYMDSGMHGYIYVKSGDPGPQGYWYFD